MSVPVTLSDLERRDARGQIFLADLHNYAHIVSGRMTEFGMVTQIREEHISSRSAKSPSQDGGASASQKCWDLLPTPRRFDLERRNWVTTWVICRM